MKRGIRVFVCVVLGLLCQPPNQQFDISRFEPGSQFGITIISPRFAIVR